MRRRSSTRLDGARIQVHRNGSDVRVHTRSLADITARVPEIVEVALSLPVDSVILDGETLMLDDDGSPRPFQDTMSRFGTDEQRAEARRTSPDTAAEEVTADEVGDAAAARLLAPRFFDVLHVDGEDLIDQPLRERLAVLQRIAPAYRIEGEVTTDPAVADRISREALAAGHEGVMVKGIDSTYAAGRRGKHWVKVKPVHTYDLVVLGVERGSGRRQGWLSNLHLGARDPEGEFGPEGGFVMVGKTFKGLTDEALALADRDVPRLRHRRQRLGPDDAARGRRRDRHRRGAAFVALPRRCRTPVRPGQALSRRRRRQARRRGRHDPGAPFVAPLTARRRGNASCPTHPTDPSLHRPHSEEISWPHLHPR